MIKELVFEGPINKLSLGNVSVNLLKSLHKKEVKVYYLPIGPTDINNFNLTDDFKLWLQAASLSFLKSYRRDLITLKNWHIQQSWHFPTDKRYLLTYFELDQCTSEEQNIVKNIDKTFFCGNYSQGIFEEYGLNGKVDSFNLAFDESSFSKTNKTYFNDGRINWGLFAKLEKRKHSLELLQIWAKKYGKKQGESYKPGEQQHFLNVQITNAFYPVENQKAQVEQTLNGQKYINIQFFWGFLDRGSWNDMLNVTDIDLTGLSGGESWNLIPFNISCLGKWSIVLNCTGMKSWANKDNCILVNPNGKTEAFDGIFFPKIGTAPFNNGNIFTFNSLDVENAMDEAIKRAKTPNTEGEKLRETFSWDKTVDYILNKIEEDLNK